MKRPPFLSVGDKVGIISPAGRIDKKYIENAIKHLNNWGLEVVLGKNIDNQFGQFAGEDKERADDLQRMIDNTELKAIICSRGGYGAIRTIERVNFDKFEKHPKWLIGYSDITVLHSYLNNDLGYQTIHATMPKNYTAYPKEDESMKMLRSCLFGEEFSYKDLSSGYNIDGKAKGIITGGNLSILYSLRGTKYDYGFTDKILFIEDVGEYLYHIDRILMNFMVGGKLNGLKGIIVGGFSDMKDSSISFGKSIYQIINDFVYDLNIPVIYDFPAGHIKNNMPIILGSKVKLEVRNKEAELFYV